ncbi:YhjD/YihY/BrkB family envelope integrity protein [Acinetobacter nectaris]|uniref:YhjD/YihY/BrkB family envelope integrity protein n=1 Tax=Acinetobacter nectaris TaxID=1219382 RepID=UPI001F02E33A|nr:YhjD/YihY/BrkB family envelope integrity protein [Acinetobacter nectaris]MCF8999714.1 YihY family inner membrane protein [Acinetobacter nectaris]MCF9028213.1 YihY family inner membrane protein [Acinetobacter nectaris]
MLLQYLKKLPFYEKTWFQFLLFVILRFESDRCRDKAASLTYTTLFAVVPMLTVFLVIISSIKALEPARQQLQELIYSNFLPRSSIAFDQTLNSFTEKSSNLTAIGILFLFITSVMMLNSIEDVFNRIWRIKDKRSGIIGFMRYWTIISLGPILLGSAFALSSAVASLNILHNNFTGYHIDSTYFLGILSYALTVLGFFFIYWTIPNREVPLRSAIVGAIFSGTIFQLLKTFFGYIMSNFTSYELVYGAFAAVPIFLLWIFLSWNIILLGVEVSFALTSFSTGKVQKRHPMVMMLDILELFYKKQLTGDTVTEKEGLKILGRGEVGRWPTYIEILETQQIIRRTDTDEYVLARNLAHIDFWEFYTELPFNLPLKKDIGNVHPDDEWMNRLSPILIDTDEYLSAKLSIPLSSLFDEK